MKNVSKKQIGIKVITSIMMATLLSISCNNSNQTKENMEQEVAPSFNLDQATSELQTSIAGFKVAMANGDAKAADYYTTDAVFMPSNGPIVTGRVDIEKTLEGCNDYLMDTEKWTLTNGKDTLVGKSLVIWKKEDGIWKQYKDMINTDTP